MATAVNRSRRSVEYTVGDEVVLTTKHIKNYCPHLPAKIKARWIGPFTITVMSSSSPCTNEPIGEDLWAR